MNDTKTNPTRFLPLLLALIVGLVSWHYFSPDSSTTVPNENAVTSEDVNLVDVADDGPISIDLIPASDLPIRAPQDETSPPSILTPAVSEAMIVVKTSGLPSTDGEFRIAVFDSKVGFPNHSDAMYTVEFSLPQENDEFRLEAMKPGDYAVAVYHDKNSDDTMNKGAFGIPTERYGFSNNARGTFGPPKFSAAVRSFEAGTQVVEIELK